MMIFRTLVLILFFSVGHGAAAENREISYLFAYIADSGCTFIRNGKEYDSAEAKEHLQYKYGRVKSRISTADDFITRIASRSSITKKPYAVQCGEDRIMAGPWLSEALRFHRVRSGEEKSE